MLKKYILSASALLLISSLITGCGGPENSTTYNENALFEIAYPKDSEIKNENNIVSFNFGDEGDKVAKVEIESYDMSEYTEEEPLKDIFDTFLADLRDNSEYTLTGSNNYNPEEKKSSGTAITALEHETYEVYYKDSDTKNEDPTKYLTVITVINNNKYILTYSAPASSYAKYKEKFAEYLKTFKAK